MVAEGQSNATSAVQSQHMHICKSEVWKKHDLVFTGEAVLPKHLRIQ